MRTHNEINRDRERTEARLAKCNADIARQSASAIEAEVEKMKAIIFNLNREEEAKFTRSLETLVLVGQTLREEAKNFDEDRNQHSARANEFARAAAAASGKPKVITYAEAVREKREKK